MNDNLISDSQWAEWALELETLQNTYPELAKSCIYAKEFLGFDHSTGCNLPLDDPWGVSKAYQLLAIRDRKK